MELWESKFGYIRERYPVTLIFLKVKLKKIIKGFIYATTIETKFRKQFKGRNYGLVTEEHLFW